MSEVKVNKVSPRSGTTVTIGDSGDTINIVGTLQNNGSPLAGDISSVVAGTGLSGGATSGVATLNIEAAQPTITSLGTITSFRSTGIDDNADATAITIDSSENVGIGNTTPSNFNASARQLVVGSGSGDNGITIFSGTSNNSSLFLADGTTSTNGYRGSINYLHNGDALTLHANATETMRLTNGNVGIGHSAPSVKLDVRKTSFTPYNTNTSLIVEAPAVFSQAQHFYIYNAGSYNSSRPTGGIGAVNASSLISLSAGSICTANPGADGFKATATSSSLYDIGSGNHEFKTKTGLTVGDQFTHQTKMIIKDNGRVGIGTTSPSEELEVSGGQNTIIKSKTTTSTALGGFEAHGSAGSYIKLFQHGPSFGGTTFGGVSGNDQSLIEAQAASSVVFSTQGNAGGSNPDFIFAPQRSQKVIIKSDGKVGIGTSSPSEKLEVNGTVKATGFDGSFPIVYAQGNSGTSCANDANTKITLDNELIDTQGLFANSRFTVTSGYEGKYLIIWQISFNHTAQQKHVIGTINVSGTTVAYSQINSAKSSNHTVMARASIIKNLSTNDYVEFFGRQDSGSTKTNNSGIYTNASITKLVD